ncbi:DUF2975 domain-containing protein [Leeuwenhoekiella sp. A16]|uniref:DUF2975 domain-containing protein n=1 Tax=Leeuwenhoekiella sp. A16 TaxID=3141462 RepID=UPI003A808EAD
MYPVFPGTSNYQREYTFYRKRFWGKGNTFTIVFFVLFVWFFLGFYQLRKFAGQLLKQKLFSKEVIKSTQKAGQFFIACGLGSLIFIAITSILTNEGRISITFGSSNFSLLLFLLIVGVLFLLLCDAFKKALVLKEENDLTV